MAPLFKPDPKLDLVIERVIEAPRELVWTAWTKPEHVRQWFTPAPWVITECEIDLRPGGLFRTRMQSPDGKEVNDRRCCYLEIIPNELLVWTDALLPGYRPSTDPFLTAVIALQPEGKATRYTATAIHRDEATRKSHEEMGFYAGWGTVLDQLAVYVKTI
ncbi:polyketide cyclase [Mesorhizobium sp. M00.F.Ca.ET.216.01.1.1]|nr:polyketide cyclase [Mesorhizobium sp. M00.F.Ca.ET.216.01.1.1]TIS54422.1 MAG: polyketide cyclase [Mesorhizobium sp.]TIS88824.1 MAG: polyketide cyclase [Mesorhizobium sp.]TJW06809.1 MAG: polyketide cyclase [Mesorhizobium sp.]TJW47850.1 MAG: polyketide cyclase [Mesorhizobium sp.]